MCYKVTGEICFVINVKKASLYTLKKEFQTKLFRYCDWKTPDKSVLLF